MTNKKHSIIIILLIVNLAVTAALCFVVLQTGSSPALDQVKYTMYVGTQDRDSGEQIMAVEDAKAIIDSICMKHLDGYTLQDANGTWTDPNGRVTHENTIICHFDHADRDAVYQIADEVIEALNQSSVLIETDAVHIDFYSGEKN